MNILEALRDPIWQGIGTIIAIAALFGCFWSISPEDAVKKKIKHLAIIVCGTLVVVFCILFCITHVMYTSNSVTPSGKNITTLTPTLPLKPSPTTPSSSSSLPQPTPTSPSLQLTPTPSNTPQSVIDAFCEAMEVGNVSNAMAQLSPELAASGVETSLTGKQYTTCTTNPTTLTDTQHSGKLEWTTPNNSVYNRTFTIAQNSADIWQITALGVVHGKST